MRSKSEMRDTVQRFIRSNASKCNIKYLRCDNAGENQELRELCEKHCIKLEWTAPNTPQENGVVERRFAIVRQKVIAMMSQVDLENDMKQMLWAEALATATTLNNITVNKPNEFQSSYVMFFGKDPHQLDHLRTFLGR